ncbi:MAG: tetraacyldisaccharide 4'-kinase [Verrucomicrobia bacterium]|nr:tetraacyldisaccharide 4'-kinase [Verrucomicrobiota bacterium]
MVKENSRERLEQFLLLLITRRNTEIIRSVPIRVFLWSLARLSSLYKAVVQFRLFLYQNGILRHQTLGCQVISVGNLTVGGTGKTPVVEVFARELQKAGRKVAILSRGYRKKEAPFLIRLLDTVTLRERMRPPRVVSDGRNLLLDSAMSGDEPYMLASNLKDVVVLVDKNRVKSGRYAINKFGCDTLILDDGFQYLALKHRVEIALVDRTNPFGNGKVLPRGVLREPVKNIRRADFIFITKCDGSGTDELKSKLKTLNQRAEIIECRHSPRYLRNVFSSEEKDLEFLRGLKVVVVSGIAVPSSFEGQIEKMGARILDRNRFVDHHRYTQQEIIDIVNKSVLLGADAVLTTEKDAVRFPRLERWDVPVYYLRVDIEILSGAEDFHTCISRICFR